MRVEAHPEAIAARDGHPLHAIVYEPAAEPERVVLVTAAMGVKQAFYEPFARYLARSGCAVITFDYRGIGKSLSGPIGAAQASLRDWGERDYPAVIDFARARFRDTPLQIVGHSVGGQLVGMLENVHHVRAVCTVGSMHGYWRRFPWRQALVDVLVSPNLAADLRHRGIERATSFSWRRTVDETVGVYAAMLAAE